jgi:hypothetical protein
MENKVLLELIKELKDTQDEIDKSLKENLTTGMSIICLKWNEEKKEIILEKIKKQRIIKC